MNHSLICIKTYGVDPYSTLKEVSKKLQNSFNELKISSVYIFRRNPIGKNIHQIREESPFEAMSVVVQISTNKSPIELLNLIKEMENRIDKGLEWSLQLKLLSYNDLIKITPNLTLPHPEFHMSPEELIPASELDPDWVHPVLKTSLNELRKKLKTNAWGEFYAQGKSLLDKHP